MEPSLARLNYLLQRYGNGEATAAERLELMETLQAGFLEEPVRQWIAETIEKYDREGMEGVELGEERAEKLLAGILQTGRVIPLQPTRLPEGSTSLPGRPTRMLRRPWMIAAAVVLLAMGAGGYWVLQDKTKVRTVAYQPARPDVPPGKHTAVLTLANGQQVMLDSAMSDTVSRQGNTTIINRKGMLAYTGLPAGSSPDLTYNTLTTNSGNQYQLILPDGSKVWLNAASSIKFPTSFGEKERKVEITGEAFFEITTNANRPFLVSHGDMAVKVLGTSFNINTYADEQAVTATLLEGAISVGQGGKSRVVRPGQQARIGAGGAIHVFDDVNTDEVVAWKNELFYFRGADMGTIMRQLARWYAIRVEGNMDIREGFYAKIPRNVPLSEVLDALSMTGKVHFDIEGSTVKVRP